MIGKIKELQLGTLINIENAQYIKDLNIKKTKTYWYNTNTEEKQTDEELAEKIEKTYLK